MTPFLVALVTASIAWLTWHLVRNVFTCSPLDNIPGPQSPSYFTGNFRNLYDRNGWDFLDMLGTKYNSVVKLTGLFGSRVLYVFDPLALHHVTIKEAELYDKPDWMLESSKMTLGPGLFGVHGATHRKQRKMLNPVFSIKYMRGLTPIFYNIAQKMRAGVEAQIGEIAATVDLNGWFGRTALELIGQGGLGRSLDSLEKPVPNPYGDALKILLPTFFDSTDWLVFSPYTRHLGPSWFRNWLADLLPVPRLNKLKKIVTSVEKESMKILEEKKAIFKGHGKVFEEVGGGKDIMSLLLQANMTASKEEGLSDGELLGQMTTLVLAATDSTSNALCKMIEIIAQRPDVQDKLRAEIVEAQEKYGEEIPYDDLVALPYLDAFCRETMRIDPPVPFIIREAQKDVIMPVSQPVTGADGTTMNEIPVAAGTTIVLGIRGSNLNQKIWGDDVLEFKPERWMHPLPSAVTESHIPGVYSNLMTFHGGGRSCIGFKFSQLEMKVVLAILIPKFKFSLTEDFNNIVWNLSVVNFPTVGRNPNNGPAFPITMECIKA